MLETAVIVLSAALVVLAVAGVMTARAVVLTNHSLIEWADRTLERALAINESELTLKNIENQRLEYQVQLELLAVRKMEQETGFDAPALSRFARAAKRAGAEARDRDDAYDDADMRVDLNSAV